jgi:WD40 repeat protein
MNGSSNAIWTWQLPALFLLAVTMSQPVLGNDRDNEAAGSAVVRCEGHTSHVTALAFSPDGRALLSASDDGTVRLWDAENGQGMYMKLTV